MKLNFRLFLTESDVDPAEIASLKQHSHAAAKQRTAMARSLSLKHVGWGYYQDKKGQITHKTERNQLKPVDPNENPSIADYLKQKSRMDRRRRFAKKQESALGPKFLQQLKKHKQAVKDQKDFEKQYYKKRDQLEKYITSSEPLNQDQWKEHLERHNLEVKTPNGDLPMSKGWAPTAKRQHGYLGPKGENKVTHGFEYRHGVNWDDNPVLRAYITKLSPEDSEKMSKENLKDPKWTQPGKHHPIEQKRAELAALQSSYYSMSKLHQKNVQAANQMPELQGIGLDYLKDLKPKVFHDVLEKGKEAAAAKQRHQWWSQQQFNMIKKHLSKQDANTARNDLKQGSSVEYAVGPDTLKAVMKKLSEPEQQQFKKMQQFTKHLSKTKEDIADDISSTIFSSSNKRKLQDTKDIAVKQYTDSAAKQKLQLNAKELGSLTEYTDSMYRDLNKSLADPNHAATLRRQNPDSINYLSDHAKNLDSAMKKHTVDSHLTVYRGLSSRQIASMKLHDLKTTHFQSPAYMSTSTKPSVADTFSSGGHSGGKHMLVIRVPKGSHALWADTHSYNQGEQELLLPRDSKFRISKVHSPDGKGIRVEAELLPHDFKGMKPLPSDPAHPINQNQPQQDQTKRKRTKTKDDPPWDTSNKAWPSPFDSKSLQDIKF